MQEFFDSKLDINVVVAKLNGWQLNLDPKDEFCNKLGALVCITLMKYHAVKSREKSILNVWDSILAVEFGHSFRLTATSCSRLLWWSHTCTAWHNCYLYPKASMYLW